MNRIQKGFIGIVLVGALMLVSSAMTPWVPMSLLAVGATPSSQMINGVTTTSGTTFVQTGWNRLTCSSDVYYLLVSAYDSTVTSATGTLLRGPQAGNGLPKPAWILVSSNQWLAILLKSGTTATCVVETVSLDGAAGSFTTLAASGATTLSSTLTTTGPNTLGLYTSLQDAGVNNLTVTGNETVAGTRQTTGTATNLGYTSLSDAGVNNLVLTNTLTVAAGGIAAGTVTRGSGALNNASPSVLTATVVTGAICVCSNNTTQTAAVKCAVSGTTLTITGPNTTTDTVSYICMQ